MDNSTVYSVVTILDLPSRGSQSERGVLMRPSRRDPPPNQKLPPSRGMSPIRGNEDQQGDDDYDDSTFNEDNFRNMASLLAMDREERYHAFNVVVETIALQDGVSLDKALEETLTVVLEYLQETREEDEARRIFQEIVEDHVDEHNKYQHQRQSEICDLKGSESCSTIIDESYMKEHILLPGLRRVKEAKNGQETSQAMDELCQKLSQVFECKEDEIAAPVMKVVMESLEAEDDSDADTDTLASVLTNEMKKQRERKSFQEQDVDQFCKSMALFLTLNQKEQTKMFNAMIHKMSDEEGISTGKALKKTLASFLEYVTRPTASGEHTNRGRPKVRRTKDPMRYGSSNMSTTSSHRGKSPVKYHRNHNQQQQKKQQQQQQQQKQQEQQQQQRRRDKSPMRGNNRPATRDDDEEGEARRGSNKAQDDTFKEIDQHILIPGIERIKRAKTAEETAEAMDDLCQTLAHVFDGSEIEIAALVKQLVQDSITLDKMRQNRRFTHPRGTNRYNSIRRGVGRGGGGLFGELREQPSSSFTLPSTLYGIAEEEAACLSSYSTAEPPAVEHSSQKSKSRIIPPEQIRKPMMY